MALQSSAGWATVRQLKGWMKKPLQYAVLRANTLQITPEDALKKTQHWLDKQATLQGRPAPKAWIHPIFREAIIMASWPDRKPVFELSPDRKDWPVVVVDATCASAVLRGAPVFKGGILAVSDTASVNSKVRVDVFRDGFRQFIGYGVIRSDPEEWGTNVTSREDQEKYETAVEVTEGLSVLPPVPRELAEGGLAVCQSLPAIACSHVLDPQPGQRILDFGAGTGFMSTHIAALTSNKAEITAVDHSVGRLQTLVNRCELLGAKVTPVLSTVQEFAAKETVGFDRIMVNPDHSSMGVRPFFVEFIGRGRGVNNSIRNFVEIAVNLLKPGGRLVYSTSSIVPLENDAVIRWLLDRRRDLKLEPAEPRIAPVGVKNKLPTPSWMSLKPDEEELIQRFGPGTPEIESDPVHADVPGYFIACLSKVR